MPPAETAITPPAGPLDAEIEAPPSKAFTQRAIFIAALADGESRIKGPLFAEDQGHAIEALTALGATFEHDGDDLIVQGFNGQPVPGRSGLCFAGQSGLNARFLTTMITLCPRGEKCTVDGHPRLRQRPFDPLFDAVRALGGRARWLAEKGFLPIEVRGGGLRGGRAEVAGHVHTQFLSAVLLAAPYAEEDVTVVCEGRVRSAPYLDVTLESMRAFGVEVERDGYTEFRVTAGQRYHGTAFTVERDHSMAAYFYAVAAITGGRIRVTGLRPDSRQGEKLFPAFLGRMGCAVWPQTDGTLVEGGDLSAIEIDIRDVGELVLPLAVVAAFARGTSRFHSVGHLAHRESERLAAVVDGLTVLGIRAERQGDVLAVTGGHPFGGVVDSQGDFRVAMAFAVAGLAARGMRIRNPGCMTRVFPGFLETLKGLTQDKERSS